jgi:uncharacterized protein YjbJ (UPF0337 family)
VCDVLCFEFTTQSDGDESATSLSCFPEDVERTEAMDEYRKRLVRAARGIELVLTQERTHVSTVDKAKNKAQEAKGRVKEAGGKATGDESLEAEGKGDKVAGNLKQAGEKVKDAFKK